MFVIHAHWQPPNSPGETGGVLIWAETSDGPPPGWQRGRLPQKPRPKAHPFCASLDILQQVAYVNGSEGTAVLRLPTTRSGPQPSPALVHSWTLDLETPPFLSAWIVRGLLLPPAEAFGVLMNLPTHGKNDGEQKVFLSLGSDASYWSRVAALALETLAAQKIVPVLVQADPAGKQFHARWLPVLDGPKDGIRLAQLEAAMPPICRSGLSTDPPSPRILLMTFLNILCDALARRWGRQDASRLPHSTRDPAYLWLNALFDAKDPTVKASPAQLQALSASHRAWMRNLYSAGGETYRIAFRLEAPQRQADPASPGWQLQYLLQARDDPSLLVPAEAVWKKTGGSLTRLGHRFEQPQERLLAGLGYAARLFLPIKESLKTKHPGQLSLNTQAAYSFLREAAPVLAGAGFEVLVPPWWNQRGSRLGLRLKMKPTAGQEASAAGRVTLERLVSYEWQLSLGESTLTEEEFKALAALKSPLVQIRGQWVLLDPDQIEAAIQFWERQQMAGEMSLLDALQSSLDAEANVGGLPVDEVIPEGWLAGWLERFDHSEKLSQLLPPQGLHAELRPYQRFGYSWLYFHRRWGLGACLADDMGLGKTLEAITLLLHEKEIHGELPAPTLVVCPTSVVTNWEREISRFAPSLSTLVHQGAGRLRGEDFLQAARSTDIVMTSYALARLDVDSLQSVNWLGVILDEAQNIKNPAAKQTQAVRQFQANFRLALTGTPVENRLSELWSIMHFLNPGYLGPRQQFRREFALPIERYHDEEAAKRLKRLTSPFILRRVKTDPRVIQDLPEKVETKDYCYLTEEQATLYQAVVQEAMNSIETKEGIERRGQVLSMLMQLKQICNHPVQYLHQGSKNSPSGSSTGLEARSGKLERLVEILEEILDEGDRALVFTQFAEMGQLLVDYLPQATGAAAQFLHGGTPVKARDKLVKRFQEDEHGPAIFILSLKAGGTGLNLTRASHVIHFDRWWNPAVEDQATDRAFRIGQKRNVQVHKFVTTGTLEEMIDDMIESKKGLVQAVVGSGEEWLTEISTQELRELVELRRR